MSAADLKGLTMEELKGKERDLIEDLFHLKLQHATGQLKNTARLRVVRTEIARVKTILNERSGAR